AEWHIQYLGECLRQQRLAAAGGADEQNVTLAHLNVVDLHAGIDALVMVIDGDRERLLGAILPDHVLVELVENITRRRDLALRNPRLGGGLLFLDDLAAQVDTLVTDVDATRPRNETLHLILALAAKGAAVGHACPLRGCHVNSIPSLPGGRPPSRG